MKEANRYVSNFHCREDAEDGMVKENAALTLRRRMTSFSVATMRLSLQRSIVCWLTESLPTFLEGHDERSCKLCEQGCSQEERNGKWGIPHFVGTDFSKNYNRLVVAEKQNQANALEDKYNCVSIFATKADTVQGIIDEINRVFSSDGKGDIIFVYDSQSRKVLRLTMCSSSLPSVCTSKGNKPTRGAKHLLCGYHTSEEESLLLWPCATELGSNTGDYKRVCQ